MNIKIVLIAVLGFYICYSIFKESKSITAGDANGNAAKRYTRTMFDWIDIAIGVAICYILLRYALKIF